MPYNPLHDEFLPSIGCAPCTRAIAVGEDFRAGRWWWEDENAKECGLHVDARRARTVSMIGADPMNAPLNVEQLLPELDHRHLDWLEEEAIFILREVAGTFERPALLFSGGKDSCVVLRLAEKAFKRSKGNGVYEGRLPFPLLHVDTGHNFPEVIEFRDRRVAEMGERLVVGHLEDSIEARHGAPRAPARIAQRPPDGRRCSKRSRSIASTC